MHKPSVAVWQCGSGAVGQWGSGECEKSCKVQSLCDRWEKG